LYRKVNPVEPARRGNAPRPPSSMRRRRAGSRWPARTGATSMRCGRRPRGLLSEFGLGSPRASLLWEGMPAPRSTSLPAKAPVPAVPRPDCARLRRAR
jgi:hypothetical protein